jgi:hypothetical protein
MSSTKKAGLHCWGGEQPPSEVALGVKDIALLNDGARRHFWEALGPSLQHPLPDDLDQRIAAFQREHDVAEGPLVRAIQACRALLRKAARRSLSPEVFAEDLRALGGEELEALLMPGWERAMTALRQEVLYGSLIDHGKLLVGVDWRVDQMMVSHRGDKLQSPVAQVTFRYMEGKEEHRLTVQALPDTLGALQDMCKRILEG